MSEISTPISVSVAEAARLLGVSRWLIYKAAESGALPSRKLGRRILIDFASLQTFAASLPDGQESA